MVDNFRSLKNHTPIEGNSSPGRLQPGEDVTEIRLFSESMVKGVFIWREIESMVEKSPESS